MGFMAWDVFFYWALDFLIGIGSYLAAFSCTFGVGYGYIFFFRRYMHFPGGAVSVWC